MQQEEWQNILEMSLRKAFPILIVAGVGNNGADGTVLARQLHGDYDVKLVLPVWNEVRDGKTPSTKSQIRWRVQMIQELQDADIIVDAIFGAGLNREVDEATQKIPCIN